MSFLRFIPETTNVDFVRWRHPAFALDGLLLLITVASLLWHGLNMGIDFTGGVMIEAKAPYTIDDAATAKIRDLIAPLNFGELQVQSFSGGQCDTPIRSCALIRVPPKANVSGDEEATAIKQKLGSQFTFRNAQVIGPKVSTELFHDGVIATVLAILLISVYVAFRFEWQYGVGALIATGHDVLVTAGFFSILHLDFSLNSVAALLLLAGYSINDTVVVFDRIRENRRKYKRMALPALINLSTNQIATRTTLVSVATALTMVPLALFGGPALRDFSGAILFGILVGTFSSTYVAAALLLYLPAPAGTTRTEETAKA
jgi:preprotein translocase subunit SecF